VQKVGTQTSDMPRKLYYLAKVKGQNPSTAQANLGLGAPMFSVQSETTGQVSQLYDASLLEGLNGKTYCILRFDKDLCTDLELLKVDASAGE
jgi:hypothetical protein